MRAKGKRSFQRLVWMRAKGKRAHFKGSIDEGKGQAHSGCVSWGVLERVKNTGHERKEALATKTGLEQEG